MLPYGNISFELLVPHDAYFWSRHLGAGFGQGCEDVYLLNALLTHPSTTKATLSVSCICGNLPIYLLNFRSISHRNHFRCTTNIECLEPTQFLSWAGKQGKYMTLTVLETWIRMLSRSVFREDGRSSGDYKYFVPVWVVSSYWLQQQGLWYRKNIPGGSQRAGNALVLLKIRCTMAMYYVWSVNGIPQWSHRKNICFENHRVCTRSFCRPLPRAIQYADMGEFKWI